MSQLKKWWRFLTEILGLPIGVASLTIAILAWCYDSPRDVPLEIIVSVPIGIVVLAVVIWLYIKLKGLSPEARRYLIYGSAALIIL